MRVRYSFPVRGTLRVIDGRSIELDQFTFRFETEQATEYVKELIIEVANVPKAQWPTITPIDQDPAATIPRFPFQVNPDVLSFATIEPYVINLEGYLSIFGLEAIEFGQIKEEWLPDQEDEKVSMQAGFSISPGPREPPANPLTDVDLARCIVASKTIDSESEALAFFRMGQMFFQDALYVDSIKYLYLCLERLFAPGKSGEGSALRELQRSQELCTKIQEIFFKAEHKNFEKIRSKYPDLRKSEGVQGFLKFLFHLRGSIQHAKKSMDWHPSRQHEFMDEALCVMHLTEQICLKIALRKVSAVPSSK